MRYWWPVFNCIAEISSFILQFSVFIVLILTCYVIDSRLVFQKHNVFVMNCLAGLREMLSLQQRLGLLLQKQAGCGRTYAFGETVKNIIGHAEIDYVFFANDFSGNMT